MSAESDKLRDTFADQLASYDDQLHATVDDVDLLAEIQTGISDLLATSGESEADIRRVLQERYSAGDLRKETFQLVKSMLDRFVSENIPTSPTPISLDLPPDPPLESEFVSDAVQLQADDGDGDDAFGSTTIIPDDLRPVPDLESRVQVGSLLRDRFLLQEEVSGGSMGVVYKAMDRRLAEAGSTDHWVAIKVLSPQLAENAQALRALQQEAAKGRCLVHPNIVRFIDLDREDDVSFIVMEWLEGRTLADILDSEDAASIDADTAFKVVRQIGEALEYAHRCGIVHADIKPGNIMMLPNGDVKLFDFGVARVRQQHFDATFDPGVLGALTPAYSSMQVLTGEEPIASDDVFSLGCLLYRLIAGYRVFGPRNAAEASTAGMTPQPLRALSQSQWRVLKKSLSYARITRFQTMREFIDALDGDLEEDLDFDIPERLVESESSSFGKWAVGLFVALGLAAIGAYQTGYLQPMIDSIRGDSSPVPNDVAVVQPMTTPLETLPQDAESPAAESDQTTTDETTTVVQQLNPVNTAAAYETPEEQVGPDPMLVDFSQLAPADVEVQILQSGVAGFADLVLREDSGDVIVDFLRNDDLTAALSLKLEEIGFSGNRSPWAGGEYNFSNNGIIEFPIGQPRGRIIFSTASDTSRESDQLSSLRLRHTDLVDSELATLDVRIEDDDQRNFEAALPLNTVAFASQQATIRETDPVAQINIVRYNPDDTSMVVRYEVSDLTATEGEDYFAPGSYTVQFGPYQRATRLLIPLVRDSAVEGDETFFIDLIDVPDTSAMGVHQTLLITIRDDVPQAQ